MRLFVVNSVILVFLAISCRSTQSHRAVRVESGKHINGARQDIETTAASIFSVSIPRAGSLIPRAGELPSRSGSKSTKSKSNSQSSVEPKTPSGLSAWPAVPAEDPLTSRPWPTSQDRKRKLHKDEQMSQRSKRLRSDQKSASPGPSTMLSPPSSPASNRQRSTSGRDVSRSPSPRAKSSSPSSSQGIDWDGRGFTNSDTPSSWGSWHRPHWNGVNEAKIWAQGPAIGRLRSDDSGSREFTAIPAKTRDYWSITHPTKLQAAVHVLDQSGSAGIVGSGKHTYVTVDARKSEHGGWVGKVDEDGRTDEVIPVLPGSKVRYNAIMGAASQDYKTRGFIRGKGTVKVDAVNLRNSDDSDDERAASTGSESMSRPDSVQA